MTSILLNRRHLLAAGGAVLATGASGLLLPARANGLAPTESMSGGANNYRKGAAVVERIGKGGFWMSGTVRRAGDGAPMAGQRIQIWARTPSKVRSTSRKATAPRSPTRTASFAWRCRKSFPSSASRTGISPMTAASSKPSSCAP